MIAVREILRTLLACRRGATAIEYGLIAGLIAVAMITGLAALGGGAGGMWTDIGTEVANAT